MNKIFLIGNLTKKPEIREAGTGRVAKFTIAVNEANGKTLFIDVNAWNKLGENAEKYLDKGRKIALVGKLERDEWQSNGEKRYTYYITAQDIEFLSKGEQEPQQEQPRQTSAIDKLQEVEVEDGDMPF